MGLKIFRSSCDNEPKRILLTRLSAIGDCILTIPLAVATKKLWPNSHLTWVVDCAAEQLIDQHPCVDEVLRIEKRWLKRPSNWIDLRELLRERQFDLSLDPQGLSKSSLLGWLSNATTRIGFDYSHAREIAPLLATRRVQRRQRHMVDTYLELLRPWQEFESRSAQFDMPVYEEAAESASQILSGFDLNAEPWVAINPGAGWSTRQWPVERFAQLANEIYQRHGRRSVVFWAGEAERLMATVISEESRGAACLAPATNLRELVELIRRSSLLVSGDTGPLHMASAVDTPCVGLFGPTWGDESGSYGNRHVAVQSPTPHLGNKVARRGPNTAMQAIEIGEVLFACSKLIASEPSASRAAA